MSNSFSVYKHTTPSGKVYIGITKQSVEKRWKNGLGYSNNSYFFNAIKKYGWENIDHEIIAENLSEERACELEKELILKYKSTDRGNGYNRTFGGEENSPSEESKKKTSQSVKAVWEDEEYRTQTKLKMVGVKRSDNAKKNISAAQKKRFLSINVPVVCVETGTIYQNAGIAEIETGQKRRNIIDCCSHRRLSAFGFHWKYALRNEG